MSVQTTSSSSKPPARWRLWVDGCGGFLLLPGNRWTVGGIDLESAPQICVRADWPRRAGVIDREGADYFWQSEPTGAETIAEANAKRELITSGQVLPIGGSAQMTLSCPSPLSTSAMLSLRGQHRFDGHVDGVVLVNETLLVGPSLHSHIQATEFPDQVVLIHRSGDWQAKLATQTELYRMIPGKRTKLQSLAMTLEEA